MCVAMLDDLALDLVANGPGPSNRTVTSLIRAVPTSSTAESLHFDQKRGFHPGPRQWAELIRDVVAMANSGGGVVLFGIEDNGSRVGLEASLLGLLDPAKVVDQLRRKAPAASVASTYHEVSFYRKTYGALVVQPLRVPLVFDTEWGYNDDGGRHQIVIRPGVLYVRTPGKSAPARQSDLREVWQRSVEIASEKMMARIERVASLPPDSELIVMAGDESGRGYVLVSGGEGRPVQITDDLDTPAVPLRDVLSTDAPYSSVASEVASQVRLWQQAVPEHRVSKNALIRWWLERHEMSLDNVAAEFCFLSAAHGHGYPMYWASLIEPSRLAEIIDRELTTGRAIPCQIYPYVVGVFLWTRRADLLARHLPNLSIAPSRVAQKVISATEYEAFVTSIRWRSRLRHSSGLVTMDELRTDRERAVKVFAELLQKDLDGAASSSEGGFAKQLDLVVHAPVTQSGE